MHHSEEKPAAFRAPQGACDAHFHVFGPAGRSLPQLPIALDGRFLVADGEFTEPPGPSYISSRRAKGDQG